MMPLAREGHSRNGCSDEVSALLQEDEREKWFAERTLPSMCLHSSVGEAHNLSGCPQNGNPPIFKDFPDPLNVYLWH